MVHATIISHFKVTLIQRETLTVAIAERKIWKLSKSKDYPEGFKYTLFCVLKESGEVLIGLDNHRPKGHHKHQDGSETIYDFRDLDKLVDDFWNEVEKRDYIL